MCTMIAEQINIEGAGAGITDWFTLKQANVSYDHPFHAPLEHALNLDFVNEAMGPGARAAVELNVNTALALVDAIHAILNSEYTKKRLVADGCGKGKKGWFTLLYVDVSYDHAYHAPLENAIVIHFENQSLGLDARVSVELSSDAALLLSETIQAVLEKADAGGHIVDVH